MLPLDFWRISLLTLFLGCHLIEGKKTTCDEKGKDLALLEVAEELLSKAEHSYPLCMENSTHLNLTFYGTKQQSLMYLKPTRKVSSEVEYSLPTLENCTHLNRPFCETKDRSFTYLKLVKKIISEMKECLPTCEPFVKRHKDCSEILASGGKRSGVYTIWPKSRYTADKPVEVYCDMDTDGGGWTVIQRRGTFSPQESFFQDWRSYKVGFGKVDRDFWLGNDNIYALSNQGPCEIRFDLEDVRGIRRFAVYKNFRIEDENSQYTLSISNYNGDVGDGMKNHNGYPFSTKDRGNTECANVLRGAWWFQDMAHVHLNGIHQPGVENRENTHWLTWLKNIGLAKVEMKVRPS